MPDARNGRRPLLALIAAMALAGCHTAASAGSETASAAHASESLRIPESDLQRGPRAVSSAEALRDLDHALLAFDEAYAGVDGLARTPPPARIAEMRVALRGQPSWEPSELAHALATLLKQPDGHLAFGYAGPHPIRLAAWPGPERDLVPSERADEPITPLGSAVPGAHEGELAVELAPGPVPVLAIRSFDNAAETEMRTLPALARRLREAKAFVVDLRGNPGGNYSFAERFVLELSHGELRRLEEREVISVAAADGRANAVRRRLARGDVPPEALPHFLAQLQALEGMAESLRRSGASRVELVTADATAVGRAPAPLRGRAVFLVDRGCASACEMLVALARQIPGVIIAGTSTRGGMAVGEIALFRLPRSGIQIWLGTRAYRDPLGDFVETRGFLPDVRIDSADPLAEARRLAASR